MNTITRRTFLGLALTLPLLGCGGGGGGGAAGSFTARSIPVTLTLPPALEGLRAALRLSTGLSEGSFAGPEPLAATVYGQGPQILIATEGDDTPILLGWAGLSEGTLSVRTTAEVLLFMASGSYLFPLAATEPIRTLLASAPAVTVFAEKLAGFLAADSKALAQPSGALIAALDEALKALLPPVTRGIKVEGGQKSGLLPLQEGTDRIRIQHSYRRRTYAYVEQIAYLEKASESSPTVRKDLAQPLPLTAFDVPRTTGVSSVNGVIVDGLIMGQTAYAPVASEPVTLPLLPQTAAGSVYRAIVIGISSKGSPDASLMTSERQSKYDQLAALTLVFDWMLSFVFNTLLGLEGAPGVARFDDFAGDIAPDCYNFLVSTLPGGLDKVRAGDVLGAGKDLAYAVSTSNSARTALMLLAQKLYQLMAARGLVKALEEAALSNLLKRVLVVLNVAGAVLNVFDLALIRLDADKSHSLESWEVTVTKPKVTLSPATAEVAPDDMLGLTAGVLNEDGSGGLVTYHGKITGGSGTLKNPTSGLTGKSLDFSTGTLQYLSEKNAPHGETVTVEVEAFLGGINDPNRRSLGKASATLTIKTINLTGHWTVVGYFYNLDYSLVDNNGQLSGSLTIAGYETAPITGTRTGKNAVISYPLTVVQRNTVTLHMTVTDSDHLAAVGTNSQGGGPEYVTLTRTSRARSLPPPRRRAKPGTGLLAGGRLVEWEES